MRARAKWPGQTRLGQVLGPGAREKLIPRALRGQGWKRPRKDAGVVAVVVAMAVAVVAAVAMAVEVAVVVAMAMTVVAAGSRFSRRRWWAPTAYCVTILVRGPLATALTVLLGRVRTCHPVTRAEPELLPRAQVRLGRR